MARAKKTVTKDIKPVRELIRLTDEFEILNLASKTGPYVPYGSCVREEMV